MELKQIIRQAGGPSKIARAIGKTHAAVLKWKRVPAHHAVTVAEMAGVAPIDLRPDVFKGAAAQPEAER